MGIIKKDGNYYIDYRDHTGKRIIRKVGPSFEQAKIILAKLQAEVVEKKLLGETVAREKYKLKESALAGSPANNFTVIVSALPVSSDTYIDFNIALEFDGQVYTVVTVLVVKSTFAFLYILAIKPRKPFLILF